MRRKIFTIIAMILIAAFALSACKTTPEPKPEPVQPDTPDQPVEPETPESIWANVEPAKEIVFWHNHSGDREAVLQKIVDDFNATNEYGITLHAEVAGRYSEIYTKMMTVLGTPDVPDIVVGYQNQIAMYQLADAIFDMNTIIDDPVYGLAEADQADYMEAFFAQDVYSLYDNQRLGIPPNRSMEVMYTNLEWLKELGYDAPPTTPEQFKEMACKAVDNPFSKGTGDAEPIGMAMRMDASNMASWVFAFGGDIYDTKTNQFTFNSPEAIEAMNFLQGLAADGCVRIVDGYNDQVQFGAGKSLFTVASSSGLGIYYPQAIAEGVGEMEWTVAPLPNTGTIKQNIYGASVSIPKSTPERELAAWIFLKYYTSPDVQVYWAKETQYFPVRKSVANQMTDFFETYPQYKTAWELIQYGAFEPAVPGYDPIRTEMNNAMATMIEDPTTKVEDVMNGLNDSANGILSEQLEQLGKPLQAEEPEPEPEKPESAWADIEPAKEIVFWHNHSGDREAVLQKIVDDFNATNEYGITLHAEVAGRYSEIYTKMMTVLGTPDVPDIVVGYQNQVAMYQLADAIFDMNTIIDDPIYGLPKEDQDDYMEAFFAQDVYSLYDNQRLGIPPNRSMEVLYYNLSWLKEMGYDAPPATPEEFKEMACKAVEQPFSKGTGDAEPIGMAMRMDASNMASWVFAFGGDIYDTKTNQFIFDSPEAIEAMTFLQSLAAEGCVRIVDGYNDQVQFGAGKSLFTSASSSGLGIYYPQAIAEGVGEMEWNVAPIPNTGKIKQNIYGASVSIPKSTPERELAAWIFLKYYTSPDVQVYWAKNTQYFPVRKSVADQMTDFFETYPQYKTAWELIQYGHFEPAVPGYDPIRTEMNNAMATIIEDPTSDVAAVMAALNESANAILAEQLEQLAQ